MQADHDDHVADGVIDLAENSVSLAILPEGPTETDSGDDSEVETKESSDKAFHLPTSRLKTIVKTVPSVNLVNSEAITLLDRATEKFISELCREAANFATGCGKKTISISHLNNVLNTLPQFEFLDGLQNLD